VHGCTKTVVNKHHDMVEYEQVKLVDRQEKGMTEFTCLSQQQCADARPWLNEVLKYILKDIDLIESRQSSRRERVGHGRFSQK
jgi:hypothetical protein